MVYVCVGRNGLVQPVGDDVVALPHKPAAIHLDVEVVQDPLVLPLPDLNLGLRSTGQLEALPTRRDYRILPCSYRWAVGGVWSSARRT